MKNIKYFLKQLLSKSGSISSKITFGIILIINAIVLAYVKPIDQNLITLINSFLLSGSGLLGVSIASDIVTKIGKGKDDK
jgi:hypothetical protein